MVKYQLLFVLYAGGIAHAMDHGAENGNGALANGHAPKILSYKLFKAVSKIREKINQEIDQALITGAASYVQPAIELSPVPRYAVQQTQQGLIIEYRSNVPAELLTPWGLIYLTGGFIGSLDQVDVALRHTVTLSPLPNQPQMRWEPGFSYQVDEVEGVVLDAPLLRDPNNFLPTNEVEYAWKQLTERAAHDAETQTN